MADPDKNLGLNSSSELEYPPDPVSQGWTMRPVRSNTPPSRPNSRGNTRNFSRPSYYHNDDSSIHQRTGSSSSSFTANRQNNSNMVAPRPLRTDHTHNNSVGSDDLSGYHTPISSSPIYSDFQHYQQQQQHQLPDYPHSSQSSHHRHAVSSVSSSHSIRQAQANPVDSDAAYMHPNKSSRRPAGPAPTSNWQAFKYPSTPPQGPQGPPEGLQQSSSRSKQLSEAREQSRDHDKLESLPHSIPDDSLGSSASSSSIESHKNPSVANNENQERILLPTQSVHDVVQTVSDPSIYNSDSERQSHQQSSQQTSTPPASTPTSTPKAIRPIKICRRCGKSISGQFVRALDASFHIDCFCCADCGQLCSAKFFPVDSGQGDGLKVPLCEYDYFRRLDLLCFDCNRPLRGSYITAIGRKYHIEHFRCSVCAVILGPEDTYYEHEDSVLCHYHYSTLHAAKCEGCQTAILKQFVEIYRGGKEFQWHAECYMIFKFWNVKLAPPPSTALDPDIPTYVGTPLYELTEEQVFNRERDMEDKVYRIWTVLCGYEEVTASCISDMLQHASSGSYKSTLLATCRLVFNIGVLFNALDELGLLIEPYIRPDKPKDGTPGSRLIDTPATTSTATSAQSSIAMQSNVDGDSDDEDQDDLFKALRREPKTLCKKLVSFMSLVSKSREKGNTQMDLSQDLLNLVTSLAHYLKILLRYGLSNCLHYDGRFSKSFESPAVDMFLIQVQKYTEVPDEAEILNALKVSALSSDHCISCGQSVEEKCVHYRKRQWHLNCLNCTSCGTPLGDNLDYARWDVTTKKILCAECAPKGSLSGFSYTTRLGQYSVLLKIAVARLQLVLNAFDARDAKSGVTASSKETKDTSVTALAGDVSNVTDSDSDIPLLDKAMSERGYMTTLRDIRRLRSTKLDKRLSQSSHKARRSVILDMPPSEQGLVKDSTGDQSGATSVQQNHANAKKAQAEEAESKSSGSLFFKKKKKGTTRQVMIQEDSFGQQAPGRTTDLFKSDKSLTLDDIPRIVAAERARELQPNSFKHRPREAFSTDVPIQKNLQDSREPHETKFISELSDRELVFVKRLAVLKLHTMVSSSFTLEDLMDFIEIKKNTSIWEKMGKAFGANRKGKSSSSSSSSTAPVAGGSVFGVPLDTLTEKHGVDSTLGVGPSSLRIPAFVDDCIQSMRQKDMSVEGIFRKNGNIRRLKEFTEKIDKNPDQGGILVEENAIQLAALLKKFLREMPEPLMISRLQKLWISAQKMPDEERKKKMLHFTCLLLPKIHRDVMEVLFYFLNWVASFAHIDEESGSKMDVHNLATVITPNILYDKEKSNIPQPSGGGASVSPAENGEAYFLSIESVYLLIEDQQTFAQVPYDIWELYKSGDFTDTMTTKEFVSKYEELSHQATKGPKNHSSSEDVNTSTNNGAKPQLIAKT